VAVADPAPLTHGTMGGMSRTKVLLLLAITAALAVGTGGAAQARVHRTHITDRAVAAVMLDHVSSHTDRREGMWKTHRRKVNGTKGADFRYHAGAGDDGDLVETFVEPYHRIRCYRPYNHCAWIRHHRVLLSWQKVMPEEDPGFVSVQTRHAGSVATVWYAGKDITRDPRRMHLEFPVRQLVRLVRDTRLRLFTTAATVRAGERVQHWHRAPR